MCLRVDRESDQKSDISQAFPANSQQGRSKCPFLQQPLPTTHQWLEKSACNDSGNLRAGAREPGPVRRNAGVALDELRIAGFVVAVLQLAIIKLAVRELTAL